LSSGQSAALVAEALAMAPPRKSRAGLVLGMLVLLAAVAVGGVMALRGAKADDASAAAVAPAAAPTTPPAGRGKRWREGGAESRQQLPREETAPTEPKVAATARTWRSASSKSSSKKNEPAAKPEPAPTATAKPATTKSQWQHDPGF
jgi:hypothetical protein